jgi:hypothetical protein
MNAPPVLIDFTARRRTNLWGVLLLTLGFGAAGIATLEYRAASARREGLEARLAAAVHRSEREPQNRARIERLNVAADALARELTIPWTQMLSELELASQDMRDSVAVLSVEPDHEKHLVNIRAESKDLAGAIAYLERLSRSRSLRYPMLSRHEVVADSNEHPVRFDLTADWREQP